MKTISLKLPESLNAKLSRVAKQRDQSKSDLVREALEQFLNGERFLQNLGNQRRSLGNPGAPGSVPVLR